MSARLRVSLPAMAQLPGVWVLRLDGVATPEGVWGLVRAGTVAVELEWVLALPGACALGTFRTQVECPDGCRTELRLAL